MIEVRPWEHWSSCSLATKDSLKMKKGGNNERKQSSGGHKYINKGKYFVHALQRPYFSSNGKYFSSSGPRQNERDKSSMSGSVRSMHRSSLSLPPCCGAAWAVWGWLNYRRLISMDEKQVWQPYLSLSMLVYLCEQERERERGGLQCKLVSTPESFCFYFVKPLKDRVYVILYSSHCQLLEETKTSNQLFFPFLVFRDVDLVKMKFKLEVI